MSEQTSAEIRDGSRGLSPHQDDGAHGVTRPADGERRTFRLPPVAVVAREKMTVSQLSQAQKDHQAGISLEAEIRRAARELGLDAKEATQIAEASRVGFRIVNGEPIPVAADRQTVLLGADGINVMSVSDWVRNQIKGQERGEDGRWKMEDGEEEILPQRNPFRRKTWNLTEQMRLARRDPKLARRLKAEAFANGED